MTSWDHLFFEQLEPRNMKMAAEATSIFLTVLPRMCSKRDMALPVSKLLEEADDKYSAKQIRIINIDCDNCLEKK